MIHCYCSPSASQQERSRHGRTWRQACFIMGDLDGFKRVNDTFGYSAGDLVRGWCLLRGECPGSSCRTGKGLIDPESGISMCFGVTRLLPGEAADSVIARCDDLLYEAKAEGRGRVESSENWDEQTIFWEG